MGSAFGRRTGFRAAAVAARIDFELLDQTPEFARGLYQLLRCLLGIGGALGCALRRLGDACNIVGDLSATVRGFAYVARHFVGGRVLFLDRGGDRGGNAIDLVDHPTDRGNRIH